MLGVQMGRSRRRGHTVAAEAQHHCSLSAYLVAEPGPNEHTGKGDGAEEECVLRRLENIAVRDHRAYNGTREDTIGKGNARVML